MQSLREADKSNIKPFHLWISKVDSSICSKKGSQLNSEKKMANSVGPNEMAHNELFHQTLYC